MAGIQTSSENDWRRATVQCPSYEAGRANGIHHSCLDFPGLVGVEVVHSRSLRKSAGLTTPELSGSVCTISALFHHQPPIVLSGLSEGPSEQSSQFPMTLAAGSDALGVWGYCLLRIVNDCCYHCRDCPMSIRSASLRTPSARARIGPTKVSCRYAQRESQED